MWRIPARRIPRRPDEISDNVGKEQNPSKEQPKAEVITTQDGLIFPQQQPNINDCPSPTRRISGGYNMRRESAGSEHEGLRKRHG